MPHGFDPGYGAEPFQTLCREYPDESVYPARDFRLEWGPIFHRGRLDGSARVLVIGQDPAAHETFVRRILVGVAGQRAQGFLRKLGIRRSYVMINAFLYSVYAPGAVKRHEDDAGIAAYRNYWLDALMANGRIEAAVALGGAAHVAWQKWKATPTGSSVTVRFAHIAHPTQPESASKDAAALAKATAALLANWNAGLDLLKPAVTHPDQEGSLAHYGTAFAAGDLAVIPEMDYPPGLPKWTRGRIAWAARTGGDVAQKRRTLVVTVPPGVGI